MIDVIAEHIDDLKQICDKHFVAKLFLFGSAAKGDFNHESSDLDMAVEFSDSLNVLDFADNYFSLLECLESLFDKHVDLLSLRALKNPVMMQEVESSKIELYAA